MKMKRFVAVFVSVMMVLGTMAAVPAFAEGETVSMGGQTYESLDLALEAIPDNGSAEITLGAGEYTLSSTFIIDDSKNITIIGAGKSITTLKIPGGSAFKIQGAEAGLKLKDLSLSIGEYKPINLLNADNVSFSAENVDVYADTTTILVYAKGVGAENSYRDGLNISLKNVNYNSNASLAAIYVQAYMGINLSVTGCSLITGPTGRTIRLHEPNSGMVSVSESTIEGFTPLYMHSRDTTMTVNDSTIIANDVLNTSVNDTSVIQVLGCTSDGNMNPGDGITYGYNNNITFNNCTLEARTVEPYAAIVGCSNAAKANTIQLNECVFKTSGTVTVVEPNEPLTPLYTSSDASNTLILNGITYNDTTITEKIYMDMTNVPEDPLNYVTLLNLIPEAKIVKADKTVGYGSLSDAVAAAQDGETVTVISDIENMTTVVVAEDKNITIDLNGHTIAAAVRSDNANKHYYAIDNYGTLILNDSVGGGTIRARGIENLSGGSTTPKMTINGGTYLSIDEGNGGAAVWNEGDLVVNGGTFKSTYRGFASDTLGAGCLNNSGTALITGGTFEGASARTYAIISTGELTVTPGEGKAVNVSGVHGGISSDSGKMVINGGNYSSEEFYGLYVSNDGVGTDPKTAFVTVNGGTFSGKNYSVWIGSDHNNPVNSSIAINGGTFNKPLNAQENTREGAICISGGTFTTDVAEYVADGYYQKNNNDGTYTVLPAEAKVIDTAKTTGATVTLDNLNKNAVVNPAADATYKVVVETAPAADAKKANEAIATNTADTNTSKAMFDISVVKIDSNGVETDLGGENGVKDQQVTLTLGETPVVNSKVFVYHVDDLGNATKVAEVTADGTNKVTFTAPSFSTYAVTYNADPLSDGEIAKKVSVAFDRVGDTNEYDIVLKGTNNLKLNRFMSADLTFDMEVTDGAVGYTIKPSTNINIVDNGNGRYEFNLDGLNASGATGAEVPIGKVIFEGNGTVEFSVKTAGTNIVNTAKSANNIVDDYIPGGRIVESQWVGILNLENKINATFTAPTKDLTVNIAYNNAISDQLATYQDMTVTVSGGDLTTPLTYALGNNTENVSFNNNTYTLTVANTLTKNTSYTVTVEGAGYRTARYTVNMATNKTLNFWNNVKDADEVIEVGKDSSKTTKNFLAGDIVKDNQINIYDLSAVVSYFGTSNVVNAESAYARYDLNRDGVIDSKDVAYVLVSWGE